MISSPFSDTLKTISLFQGLSDQHLNELAEICLWKNADKKEMLFMENERGQAVYILIKGNVQLFKSTADGKEIVIRVVKPGEMFAEAILFEKDRYPVSAVTLSESRLMMIPKAQFTCLLVNESFRNSFIAVLMQRLRFLSNQIKALSSDDVEERFFNFLAEQFAGRTVIKTKLSKKDAAAAIGTTPETLSRILLRLKNQKRLEWTGSTIRIFEKK